MEELELYPRAMRFMRHQHHLGLTSSIIPLNNTQMTILLLLTLCYPLALSNSQGVLSSLLMSKVDMPLHVLILPLKCHRLARLVEIEGLLLNWVLQLAQ